MKMFGGFASFVLAASIVSTLSAETHCSGNAASLPLRFVNRHQMVVAVSINHTGLSAGHRHPDHDGGPLSGR